MFVQLEGMNKLGYHAGDVTYNLKNVIQRRSTVHKPKSAVAFSGYIVSYTSSNTGLIY
jgi:hypothetical protein